MLNRILPLLLILAFDLWSGCVSATIPTDYLTVDKWRRAGEAANWTAIKDAQHDCADSLNLGPLTRIVNWNTALQMKSLQDLGLKMDDDNNGSHRFAVLNGVGDTVFRVTEDSAARVYGSLTVDGATSHAGTMTYPSLTASLPLALNASKQVINGAVTGTGTTQVLSISPSITGTLAGASSTWSGTVGVTGAFSLASSLTFAAGQDILIADNSGASLTITQGGNPYLRFVTTDAGEKASVFKALEAQSTLAVTGLQSNSEAIAFVANGTGGAGRIYRTASDGLLIRGITGSSLDLVLENASGNDIFRNSTGTTSVDFPGSGVTVAGTLAVTGLQSNSEALAFAGNGTAGAGRIFKDATNGIVLRAATGSARDMQIQSQGGTVVMQIPTGTSDVAFPNQVNFTSGSGVNFTAAPIMAALAGTGTRITTSTSTGVQGNATTIAGANTWSDKQTHTTAPRFNSVSASEFLMSDGSKDLTSVGGSGSGNVVRVTGATLVAPALGAATATTIALGGNEAFDYDEGLFTAAATGMSACTNGALVGSTCTGTAYYTRIGKMVHVYVPPLLGTSSGTSLTITGLPPALNPARSNETVIPSVVDNSNNYTGFAILSAAGVFTFSFRTSLTAYPGNVFTASGLKGHDMFSFTYTLQ